MSEKEVQEAMSKNDQRMDAIKQLIFGENMVEYDQRFDDVLKKLQATQKELELKLESLDKTINDTIDRLNKEFEAKNNKLEEKFNREVEKLEDKKTNRKALGKMLQTIGEKLQA